MNWHEVAGMVNCSRTFVHNVGPCSGRMPRVCVCVY